MYTWIEPFIRFLQCSSLHLFGRKGGGICIMVILFGQRHLSICGSCCTNWPIFRIDVLSSCFSLALSLLDYVFIYIKSCAIGLWEAYKIILPFKILSLMQFVQTHLYLRGQTAPNLKFETIWRNFPHTNFMGHFAPHICTLTYALMLQQCAKSYWSTEVEYAYNHLKNG